VRSTLRHLTSVRGVLAAGVFDEFGTRLAVCGRPPAIAALTFADANPSFAAGVAPSADEPAVARDEYDGARVMTVPLASGVLELVVEAAADAVDPLLARHVDAAARALNLVLEEALAEASPFIGIDTLSPMGSQGPTSETMPCFMRPPGY
jgi:hypothetical protein